MASVIGTFSCSDCGCCDGNEYSFDDRQCKPGRMRCTNCGCQTDRPPTPGLTLRLYLNGPLTLEILGLAREVAESMGATQDTRLQPESTTRHFFEIPAETIAARLEIERMRGGQQAPVLQ